MLAPQRNRERKPDIAETDNSDFHGTQTLCHGRLVEPTFDRCNSTLEKRRLA
jgi:hypothetical protein